MLDLLDKIKNHKEEFKPVRVKRIEPIYWTQEETDTLRQVYECSTKKEIQAAIPGRNWRSIIRRANYLGMKMDNNKVDRYMGNQWTDREDTILRDFWDTKKQWVVMEMLPNRSNAAINTRVTTLGLRQDKR